jgi:hypothetical protein
LTDRKRGGASADLGLREKRKTDFLQDEQNGQSGDAASDVFCQGKKLIFRARD